MSIYDKASLVLIPSGTKTSKVYSQKPTNGDGDFTFSRSTAATRVNASGNIEKETQNLVNYSNTFSTGWVQDRILSATGGQAGYDGSNDAWFVVPTNVVTYHTIRQSNSQTGIVTISVYAKAETYNGILLYSSSNTNGKFFNVSNGTLGDNFGSNVIDATITDVGNGWYRCSVTLNKSGGGNVEVLLSSDGVNTYTFAGDGVGGVYIQDFQLEQGLVARDYIETTTTAIYGGITDNVPRLDYTDSSCPALLLEPQRFNAIDSSEYGGAWSAINSNITKTENATTSPEGVNNAVKLEGLTTSSANQIVNFGTTSLNGVNVVGKTYTASVYLKPVNAGDVGKDIVLSIQRNSGDFEGFNVTTEITSADWKRYDLTYTFTGAGAANQIGANFKILRDGGTSIDDIYIWGVQFEEGSYATSYIPTYGSAVTRNADRNETTPNTLISSQVFSMFFEYTPTGGGTSGSTPAFELNIQGTSNNVSFYVNNSGANDGLNIYLGPTNGGYLWGTATNNGWTLNQKSKVALTYDGDNLRYFINGVLHRSQTGVSFTNATTALYILHAKGNEVEQALVFPTALTDQEAIDLTTL